VLLLLQCSGPDGGGGDQAATSVGGLDWMTDVDRAMSIAANQDRPIFMFFTGSDWCGWCKRLSGNVLTKPEFKDYAEDQLVLLMLDFPRRIQQSPETQRANSNLAKRYGVRGFPTIILTDETGQEIARTGYKHMSAAQYVQHLKSLLRSS
jgi:protein disulfide-isomerase